MHGQNHIKQIMVVYCYNNKFEKSEMGGACSTCGKKGIEQRHLKERVILEYLGVDWSIILKCMLGGIGMCGMHHYGSE